MPGRRPSAVLIGLAALILAVAGLMAAATHDPDEEMTRGAAPVETTTSFPEPTSTSSTMTTLVTTTVGVVPTTRSGSPSTTLRRGVTTTVARGTATSRPASPTTTSATAPPCTAAQIEITAATEKASYARNEKVKVDSTLRNRSADTCFFVSYSFSASFRDPGGQERNAYNSNPPGSPDTPLAPGQVIRASATWDPLACPDPTCFAAPAGGYSVLVTWGFPGGPYTALRPFTRT
ncbi:MAG: hypothetical protein LC799_02620 [Actinobacteria bacterium]|nr:hypothetical protein [Actinomycetota bacterium]